MAVLSMAQPLHPGDLAGIENFTGRNREMWIFKIPGKSKPEVNFIFRQV